MLSLRRRKGFTLAESLVTITVATLVALGLFQSNFTSIKATVQTEQGLDAANIMDSEFADVLGKVSAMTLPHEQQRIVKTRSTDFSVSTRVVEQPPGYCAKVSIDLDWKQGNVEQHRHMEALVPLAKPEIGGAGPP